jgi:hypothetical protein
MDIDILLRDLIRPELNKMYTEPPSSRGGGDMGLFCKEHAFHCMILCRMLGHSAVIKRGDLTFRLEKSTVYSSFGTDTDHAWCQVDDTVPVDLSANFEYYESDAANIDLVYGSGQRGPYTISYTADTSEYERDIADRTALPRLYYLETQSVELAMGDLLDDPHCFLIKPPRAGMTELFGRDVFSAINMHLLDLANGKTKRLTTYKDSKNTVKTIVNRYPQATAKAKALLALLQ